MLQDACLIKQPYIIDDEWAIVGHTGWYDYAFANGKFSLDSISASTCCAACNDSALSVISQSILTLSCHVAP
jgi:hypothetical protein